MVFTYKGCDVHYEIEGSEGMPVLMLHGFGCNLELMRGCFEPAFEGRAGYRRVYVDFPGHGQSGASLEIASSDELVSCVLALMDEVFCDEPFLVCGESYGGYIALGVVCQRPQQCCGMHLICPLTVDSLEHLDAEKPCLLVQDEEYLASLSDEDRESLLMMATRADKIVGERFFVEDAPGFAQANPEFMAAIDEHFPLSIGIDKTLSANPFEAPSLILCGRQDSVVGYRDQQRLIDLMPRCSYAILDIAGHNLQIEQRELMITLVHEWLDRVEHN